MGNKPNRDFFDCGQCSYSLNMLHYVPLSQIVMFCNGLISGRKDKGGAEGGACEHLTLDSSK